MLPAVAIRPGGLGRTSGTPDAAAERGCDPAAVLPPGLSGSPAPEPLPLAVPVVHTVQAEISYQPGWLGAESEPQLMFMIHLTSQRSA